jgi:hypothetical protein
MDSMTDVPTRKTRVPPERRSDPGDYRLPRTTDRGQGIRDFFNDALGPPRPEREGWPLRLRHRFRRGRGTDRTLR